MSEEWLTIPEVADRLNVTERTVRRYISNGRFQTKMDGKRKLIFIDDSMTDVSDDINENNYDNDIDTVIEMQREEINRLHKLLEDALEDARQAKERSDTIVLQLTQQVEQLTGQNQLLLEDLRPKRRWYHRLFAWNGT